MEEDEDEEEGVEVGLEAEKKEEDNEEQEEEENEADEGSGHRLHLQAGMPPQMDLLGEKKKWNFEAAWFNFFIILNSYSIIWLCFVLHFM